MICAVCVCLCMHSSCLEWSYAFPLLEEAGLETWAVDVLGWGFSDLGGFVLELHLVMFSFGNLYFINSETFLTLVCFLFILIHTR